MTEAVLDKIFVRDLEVEALIGIYDNEKANQQIVIINADAWYHPAPDLDDQYSKAICYESIIRIASEEAKSGHVNLVETLAENIASRVLEIDRIQKTRIKIEKPEAINHAHSVCIEIIREI